MKTKIFKAFTLIELLIVIVIIGILATALIPRVTGVQTKARYTRVEKDFRDFRAAVFLAQSNTNKTLRQITNNTFSVGACRNTALADMNRTNIHLSSLGPSHTCRVTWIESLRRIESAAGMSSGTLAGLETDPWGSPYLLDENEAEFNPTDCRPDFLWSAGPDGYFDRRSGDGYANWVPTTGIAEDSRVLKVTPMGCPGAY